MPTVKELLQQLDLGNSVAEFDDDLEDYFVETEAFRSLVNDKIDIVAGDKGTGKTAIYRILQKRFAATASQSNIRVLPAFNPRGTSIFVRLGEEKELVESEYNDMWKAYIFALIGNWLLRMRGSNLTPTMLQLDKVLRGLELREQHDTPESVFARILKAVRPLFWWKSAELKVIVGPDGSFTFGPKVEFRSASAEVTASLPASAVFRLLEQCLRGADLNVWVAIDRLDEAFQDSPAVEIPALRALFRVYLDLLEFPSIRMKLFVRRDLFRRITSTGFVNLTHVNARKFEVIWDEEDLLSLLSRRIRKNVRFCENISARGINDLQLFDRLFPQQVDAGLRKPKTWVWIMRRIRDGNDVKPPRNLIDFVKMSQQAQLRSEDRTIREYKEGSHVLEPDALRRALGQLSDQRVNDTLLAEAGFLSPMIESFRGGKAEHNEESLSRVLKQPPSQVRTRTRPLVEMGFLEEIKGSFKVPSLYRDGLQITQGKAFSDDRSLDEDDD